MSHQASLRGAVALLLPVIGCVPAVAHSPRVWPGPSVGVSLSGTAGPKYESGDDGRNVFLLGPVGLNAGYGWRPEGSDRPGFRVGVHVPVPFVALAQPDLYIQAPPRVVGGLDVGVGVSAVAAEMGRVAMPYVQVGSIGQDGSGWYTTQGFYSNTRNVTQAGRPVLRSDAWVPSIAYAAGGRRHTTHVFATGVVGQQLSRCDASSNEVCERASRWAAIAGVSVEWHRRRRQP